MKKLTKGQENLIIKYNLMDAPHTDPLAARTELRYNPFGGDGVPLNPFEANLYDMVNGMYARYTSGDPDFKVQEYDRLKFLFLHFNPSAYMALID